MFGKSKETLNLWLFNKNYSFVELL